MEQICPRKGAEFCGSTGLLLSRHLFCVLFKMLGCYGRMSVSLQNPDVETPTPIVLVFGDDALGGDWV